MFSYEMPNSETALFFMFLIVTIHILSWTAEVFRDACTRQKEISDCTFKIEIDMV